ncbi:MAG: hydrogenase expression/formation C-terminal domain-containing protein [Thiohalocapsa sp.]
MNKAGFTQGRPIPPGAVGPGTQPDESDGAELEYLSMPGEMQTYRQPLLPEPEDVAGLTQGLWLLRALQQLLGGYRVGALPQVIDLAALDDANLRLVEDSLGEGEVSIRRADPEPALDAGPGSALLKTGAQETRLAGVWRVRDTDDRGKVCRDALEVSDVPGFVRYRAFASARDLAQVPATLPDGVMNAPGVLAEVNEHVAKRTLGGDVRAQVVNLTLLPQSEQDLSFLGERLGAGSISILSRGYGNCRITSTAVQDVWWVQFYNSDDRLILNSLEITDVPEAALAAQQDIDDSAARLREILDALQ